jgi:hypothetical protein
MYYGNDPVKKQQNEELAKLVQEADAALRRAEAYADEVGISFYFAADYGMGGSYFPKLDPSQIPPEPDRNDPRYWDWYETYANGRDGGGWSSSSNC